MAAALLEPALLRRLESLALRVRRAVSGQMGGERRSRRRGQSVEFADFRNDTPGDDFRLIARLQSFPAGGVTNYEKLVWPIGRQRPGMSVLISDGLGQPTIDPALMALQRAQQEGAVLQLLAPQEIAPDWTGDARLKDAETGLEREFTATPLTQGSYLRALAQRTDELERAAHRRVFRVARLSSAEPMDELVQITP